MRSAIAILQRNGVRLFFVRRIGSLPILPTRNGELHGILVCVEGRVDATSRVGQPSNEGGRPGAALETDKISQGKGSAGGQYQRAGAKRICHDLLGSRFRPRGCGFIRSFDENVEKWFSACPIHISAKSATLAGISILKSM
jgi:hypothetical protein